MCVYVYVNIISFQVTDVRGILNKTKITDAHKKVK